LFVGIFVGLSGVGGGSLMTPLLILVLRMHPAIAIGTDLLYSVPTKLVGAFAHAKAKTVDSRLAIALAIGGVPGALAGVFAVSVLRKHVPLETFNAVLRHAVGIALLIAATAVVIKLLPRFRSAVARESAAWDGRNRALIVTTGAIVGFCVSVTSIGSGSVTLPTLMALLPALGLRKLIGSDVMFAAVLLPVAALGALAAGNVNVPLALNLVVGSVPGVLIGSRVCSVLPERFLRPAVASVLIFAGSRLI
jgi:uncharacterized membrane protein YfcA